MKISRLAAQANPCHPAPPVPSSQRFTRWGRHLSALWVTALMGQTAFAASVNVAWNPNAESDIAGYKLSYGSSSGNYSSTLPTGKTTSATVSGLTDGQLYYFVLRAVNTAGVESASSTEISYRVPLPANTPPVAIAKSVTTLEDQSVSIVLTGSDVDGDPLSYQIVSGPAKGTLSGSVPNVTYVPAANVSGSDSFTFLVSDGKTTSNTATVSIGITAVNDAPSAISQQVAATAGTSRAITLTAQDVDGDPLTYNLVSVPTQGTLSGTPPNLTYLPNANAAGSDSFGFRVSDGKTNSNIATVSISVTATPVVSNRAPVASSTSVTTLEDQSVSIVLSGSDADGDPLSYQIVSGPAKGTLSGSAPNVTYVPAANVSGSDSFTFLVSDGKTTSNTATVSIGITAVNDAPSAISQQVAATAGSSRAITLTAQDVDGDPLTYNLVSVPTQGTLSGTPPNLTYLPNANASGSDSFGFRVSDGKTNSSIATVSISVTAAPVVSNRAPVASSTSVTTLEDQSVSIVLSGSDADGDPLSYQIASGPAKGTLSGSAPNVTYVPAANVSGSDSFTFVISDGKTTSNTATVSIGITAVNDAPSAISQQVAATAGSPQTIILAAEDVDGDPLTYNLVSVPTQGALSGTPPNLTYLPNANASGSDSFGFRVSDGKTNSSIATVSISVTAAPVVSNKAPVFQSSLITRAGGSVDVMYAAESLAGSAVDPEGGVIRYSKAAGPAWLIVLKAGRASEKPELGRRKPKEPENQGFTSQRG